MGKDRKKVVICPMLIPCSRSLGILFLQQLSKRAQVTGDKVSQGDKFKLHHPTFPKVTVQVLKYRGRNAAAKSKLPRPRADHCAILSLQLRGPCSCLLNSERNGLKRLLQKWEAASHQYHLVKKQTALGNTMAILYLND